VNHGPGHLSGDQHARRLWGPVSLTGQHEDKLANAAEYSVDAIQICSDCHGPCSRPHRSMTNDWRDLTWMHIPKRVRSMADAIIE
jgi:hypothetical protein